MRNRTCVQLGTVPFCTCQVQQLILGIPRAKRDSPQLHANATIKGKGDRKNVEMWKRGLSPIARGAADQGVFGSKVKIENIYNELF